MPVNFLIFLVNASAALSASILLHVPARRPQHHITAVPASTARGFATTSFMRRRVLCVPRGTPWDVPQAGKPQNTAVAAEMPAWLCIPDAAGDGFPHQTGQPSLSPAPDEVPTGTQRGFIPVAPPGEGRAGAGCLRTGAGSAGSRLRCADEMWQACNKPLVTVTFARQPLAG